MDFFDNTPGLLDQAQAAFCDLQDLAFYDGECVAPEVAQAACYDHDPPGTWIADSKTCVRQGVSPGGPPQVLPPVLPPGASKPAPCECPEPRYLSESLGISVPAVAAIAAASAFLGYAISKNK